MERIPSADILLEDHVMLYASKQRRKVTVLSWKKGSEVGRMDCLLFSSLESTVHGDGKPDNREPEKLFQGCSIES